MKNRKLKHNFNLLKWESEDSDIEKFDPCLAARMLFDVLLINEFEHAVLRLKKDDCVWGPVHTSVGQEATAAATVQALRKTDKFTGTHRSHHHFLSKVMHHILPESWNPASDELPEEGTEAVKRTLAEIMGLKTGYCGGRGGSMHLRNAEAGFLGSNAIVAGGIPLSVGAAFAEKFKKTNNIVVCFFSDGALNQGAFHEACNFAGIWSLPIIFFIENNYYSVATHTDDVCAVKDLASRASSYAMDGHIVDGNDVVAIHEVVKKTATDIREGGRPCFIEARCYRRYHHAGDQAGSAFKYRSKDEEEKWAEREVSKKLPADLLEADVLSSREVDRIKEMVAANVVHAVDSCTLPGKKRTVREELWPSQDTAADGLRSDGREWEGIEFSERKDFAQFEDIRLSDAIAAVTNRWLEKDPLTFVLGEEVANFGGGAYGATKGAPKKFPDRVLNAPISEAGIVGLGLGASMLGLRAIVEIMFPDFALVAADQLFNQVAKARHMYGGTTEIPLVVRTRIAAGCGYGGQHSMDPIGLYALFPGWRIAAPSNAFDYIGLFNSAMQSLDPVVFLEHHSLYTKKFPIPKDNLDYFIPFGKARRVTTGNDVTVITYGAMALRCEALNEQWASQGVSAEIIDLRSVDLLSIDYQTIGDSIRKTNAAVVVEEAATSQSIGGQIASQITERFFDDLDGPVTCLSSLNVPISVSRVLEAAALLSNDEIVSTTTAVAKRQWR